MGLVRSNHSNPALKQHLGKARFLWKIFFDCGIKSAAVYAAKAKKPQLSGRQWGVYFLQNLWPNGVGTKVQTLLFQKAVKKFALDKDEWVLLQSIIIWISKKDSSSKGLKVSYMVIYRKYLWWLYFSILELWLVRYEPISMTIIIIRCSSPGLFAVGVKEISRVYCDGSLW